MKMFYIQTFVPIRVQYNMGIDVASYLLISFVLYRQH